MSATITKNKKAYHDFEILDQFEAGIILNGDEVKSIKSKNVNLKGSFVDIDSKNEAYINEMHVSRYKHSARKQTDPTRKRKLLLHTKEINKIAQSLNEQGVTAIPLELYLKKGLIKVKIGLCRGKKLHDKRQELKKRSQEMDIRREMSRY